MLLVLNSLQLVKARPTVSYILLVHLLWLLLGFQLHNIHVLIVKFDLCVRGQLWKVI